MKLSVLSVLCILTLAYVVAIGWLVLDPDTIGSQGYVAAIVQELSVLKGREHNELGDFLAGAFAPLAFFWLGGTVFIQSKELAEQRKELAATREAVQQEVAIRHEHEIEATIATILEALDEYLEELQLIVDTPDGEQDILRYQLFDGKLSRRKRWDEFMQIVQAYLVLNQVEHNQFDKRSVRYFKKIVGACEKVAAYQKSATLNVQEGLDADGFGRFAAFVFYLAGRFDPPVPHNQTLSTEYFEEYLSDDSLMLLLPKFLPLEE